MVRKSSFLWLLTHCVLSLAACGGQKPAAQRPGDPTIARHLTQVRAAYSGDRARETVAYLERFWRLPGNDGYNASIARVVEVIEDAGYVLEERAEPGARLTYRIERRPMDHPTWEPVDGALDLVGHDDGALLRFSTNRNMIAINSYSTPREGVEAELAYVGAGSDAEFDRVDVRGKIVFGDASARGLFREAVQRRGAVGVLSYSIPGYNQPERYQNSIQFSSIPLDSIRRSWAVRLSYAVRQRLKQALETGPVRVQVRLQTRVYKAEELTLVADIHGLAHPHERLVLSAHVQEPGANDNASGVGAQAEAARVLAELVRGGGLVPARSITMLWGDEIRSTQRYIADDSARAAGIRWGVSLDMVGEDTDKTGGTFLIEKMPDPSAVWTRGEDVHSEWGGRPLSPDNLTPHYLNDFVLNRCLDQAEPTGWIVKTNPYEGGSDHVPFLRAGIPGLLLWHFTDVFYHTDGDRLKNVSPETLENVGVCTVLSAITLTTAGGETARFLIRELEAAALARLAAEYELSRAAIAAGEDRAEQKQIVRTWMEWYRDALRTTDDIEVGGSSDLTLAAIEAAVRQVIEAGESYLQRLEQ